MNGCGGDHTAFDQRCHVFAIMRSDPALTHTFATAHSIDGGRSFGPVSFAPNLTSIACQLMAVAVNGPSGATRRRLFVAGPRLNDTRPLPVPVPPRPDGDLNRYRMTVMVSDSDDEGMTFPSARAVVVYEGGSFYSNLADGGAGDVLLIFERAGNTSSGVNDVVI